MVKRVEEWKLKKSIDKDHNFYVRIYLGAKLKCMKDYVKPSIREKNPDYIILHVRTNELNSDLPSEGIARLIIDVAESTPLDNRIVSISDIAPRNDNFNIKAVEVHKELSKMSDKQNLFFPNHNNINPKSHLNKSKL